MKAVVLFNRSAGTCEASAEALEKSIGEILSVKGLDTEFRCVSPQELRNEAAAAVEQNVGLVVACGGDGTVSSIASALVGSEVILGVLPMGTLNHFAKDLNIPLDLASAAEVIAAGYVEMIDVGQVNERIFINNSSLGLYSQLALERDAQRNRWGIGKWLALSVASIKIFIRFPMVRVRLEADEKSGTRKTPIVFVGNNEYRFDQTRMGSRLRLDGGALSLYIANTRSRWGMLRLTLRAVFGRLQLGTDLEASMHADVWITSHRQSLLVAADGEVTRMQLPLHYRIRPRSLRVCVVAPSDAS